MDWNKDSINLYLDNELLNYTLLNQTINASGVTPQNPFLQKHYFLLNLAIGGAGGDPSQTTFPLKYEVDYIRVYQSTVFSDIKNNSLRSKKMEIFPNPASDYFCVEYPEAVNALEIIDLSGRVLKKYSVADDINIVTFPLSDLHNGVYMLNLHVGNAVEVSKLIVRK